jgi:ATP-dependent exoDNAse (exonuclease V) beta subunit
LRRARAAEARGRCRRETPITRKLADGTLVEGVVDLAFEENGTWIVVDYKTDRELRAAGIEQYRRQVALYAEAIRRSRERAPDYDPGGCATYPFRARTR